MEYNILVADDEYLMTDMLVRVFINKGYKVLSAASGEKCKEIVDSTPLDLVLLDIKMPGISGLEALKHIKKRHPDIKVIMITGYSEFEQQARSLGCDGFMSKPVSVRKLISVMEEILYKKDYEELKQYTMGSDYFKVMKGSLMADIMLIEVLPEISEKIERYMTSVQLTLGHYNVYPVENIDKAETLQELLSMDIVMMNMRSTLNAKEIIDALEKKYHPPRKYIFYFKPETGEMPKHDKAVHWDGNPLEDEDLPKLAELINSVALECRLVKE